jgi:hypothetical protein
MDKLLSRISNLSNDLQNKIFYYYTPPVSTIIKTIDWEKEYNLVRHNNIIRLIKQQIIKNRILLFQRQPKIVFDFSITRNVFGYIGRETLRTYYYNYSWIQRTIYEIKNELTTLGFNFYNENGKLLVCNRIIKQCLLDNKIKYKKKMKKTELLSCLMKID